MQLSESLRRPAPAPMPSMTTKQQERLEIQSQVREFLGRGGRIETLPTRVGDPDPEPPKKPSQDNMAGFKADLNRGALMIDGEQWVSTDRAAKLSGWSKPVISKAIVEGRFPPIRKVSRRNFVRLTDALTWAAANGKFQCDRDAALAELEAIA